MTTPANVPPLAQPTRFDAPALLEEWLHEAGMGSLWPEHDSVPQMYVDIHEDDKAFRIKAEMPGVGKDDVEISVRGNHVAISAELKRESKNKDAREIIAERTWGKTCRVFALPGEIDAGRMEAHYDKGVLALTLPKKTDEDVRQVEVT